MMETKQSGLREKHGRGVEILHLYQNIKHCAGVLRREYGRLAETPPDTPTRQWLWDNYYVLEREAKQTQKELRHVIKNRSAEALYALYRELERQVHDRLSIDTASIAGSLERLCEPPTLEQLDLLPLVLRLLFLAGAASAFEEGLAETEAEGRIRYAVESFAKLGSVDFEKILCQASPAEQLLESDPADVYRKMTTEGKSHYRYLLRQISRRTGYREETILEEALRKAREATEERERHVGTHLLEHPALAMERRLRGRAYLISTVLVPLLLANGLGFLLRSPTVVVLSFLPLWEIARPLCEQVCLWRLPVDRIPQMELSSLEEVPCTTVVISTLLPRAEELAQWEEKLTRMYFANKSEHIQFCMLADLKVSDLPVLPEDALQVNAAREMVESLNKKYGQHFMLYVRKRAYSKTQDRYSGWERKRGAITEFVRYLKGGEGRCHTFVGDKAFLGCTRYLLAVDSDTNLLFDEAEQFVAAACHPANKPVIDERRGIVTAGYGILVPRVITELESARATVFSRIMEGSGGVTGYDTLQRDLYQDLFEESIFSGKGLIDVDAFYTLLDSRFPENQVLSHDILEGAYLRVGHLSGLEVTDAAPKDARSWFARLHRWMRGDWQNLPFLLGRFALDGEIYQNSISLLNRYKLWDNLRRSLTPVFVLCCVFSSLFLSPIKGAALAVVAILALFLTPVVEGVRLVFFTGGFALRRKYFTDVFSQLLELFGRAVLMAALLPYHVWMSLSAMGKSLFRTFGSRKNLLEWQTFAQTDRKSDLWANLKAFGWVSVLGIGLILFAPQGHLRLFGVLFALAVPLCILTAKEPPNREPKLTRENREKLLSYNAAMWQYYETHVTAENNYLPPDNIQLAPVSAVAQRTSPTNIGMYLLSVLAARDMGFVSSEGLYNRVARTIDTIEQMEKYQGNLYNWYDTTNLRVLPEPFVSTVDSGNFTCCLVALQEGLLEYAAEWEGLRPLAERIQALVEETDLRPFYHPVRDLFSIGYDEASDTLSGSHYDFLMSEARMTSYFAIAKRQAPRRHWGALGRTLSRQGVYAGPVSWTGTMFEYFMPHLLLPSHRGTLLDEALRYCIHCQRHRVRRDLPWGVSESAYYAFDSHLNYQYKAHGVQSLGVKRHLNDELVLSPYSSFLTLMLAPNRAMENLTKLEALGAYGNFGFYEAVDCTASRLEGAKLAVIKSYMAHHIGMSMVASANAMYRGVMQRRFMRDNDMKAAGEFLQERVKKDAVVYDRYPGDTTGSREKQTMAGAGSYTEITPCSPRATLLSNGELTHLLTDVGAGVLQAGGVDITRRSGDLLRRPQGMFCFVKEAVTFLSLTRAPFYDTNAQNRAHFGADSVVYTAEGRNLSAQMELSIHRAQACEQVKLTLRNTAKEPISPEVLFYFEPTLTPDRDYRAHPAFSKLFVVSTWDRETKTITFTRRNRDARAPLFLTVGFLEDIDFEFELKKENLMSAPGGMEDLREFDTKAFTGAMATPDGVCALRFRADIPALGSSEASVLLATGVTAEKSLAGVLGMRRHKGITAQTAAVSPFAQDQMVSRLGASLLGELLFDLEYSETQAQAIQENKLGQSGLWKFGISGDDPLVLLEVETLDDIDCIRDYINTQKFLRTCDVRFDLCLLFVGAEPQENVEVARQLVAELKSTDMVGSRGGVHLLETGKLLPEDLTLLHAVARHRARGEVKIATARGKTYTPVEIQKLTPAPLPEDGLEVEGGVFKDERFYVDRRSPLPYSHILANPVFGTLLSDSALGYTWMTNARENKLTPWYNDIATDNNGEMLLSKANGLYYNLINGSRASFSEVDAQYHGVFGDLESKVKVSVSETGCVKTVQLLLHNNTGKPMDLEVAYYTEPVLGVDRQNARYSKPKVMGSTILFKNPYNTAVPCCMALDVDTEQVRACFDRAAFFSGDWSETGDVPSSQPAGVLVAMVELEPGQEREVTFRVVAARSEKAVRKMLDVQPMENNRKPNRYLIDTPDHHLNQFINHFAPHQIVASRMMGRTAFYQCGGAYGFRDQLQDACAYLLVNPDMAKVQIYRCCGVQFEEGDVLHWWHRLPKKFGDSGIHGVRTRFSDDLLFLPWAVARYVQCTGDCTILDTMIPYIESDPLLDGEQERYLAPGVSGTKESVYRHCIKALLKGDNPGELGIPLIGCGDWNDGFSGVGADGKGQSVWLGMFLVQVMEDFLPICEMMGDRETAQYLSERVEDLKAAIDRNCWDGKWYLRAFYDDGEKMGSHESEECTIDLLPQSFAVFAGMPDKERVRSGLEEAFARLVDQQDRIVSLFSPAFDKSGQNPGYVKAYPKGIRENGGQYTHSAVWFAMALLRFGMEDEGNAILKMLNPVYRSSHPRLGKLYKVEPYYMAADIYTSDNARAHGGWTLYTGAVSWYYRAILEEVIGLKVIGERLAISPKLPKDWGEFGVQCLINGTELDITYRRDAQPALLCDGNPVESVPLDGGRHRVEVVSKL